MKQFFKFLFASVLGFIIGSFLLFLVLMGFFGALASLEEKEVTIKPNSVLYLDINYEIPERTPDNPFKDFDFSSMQPKKRLGLNEILRSIEAAKEDDDIKGIYISSGISPNGMATLEAIRDALEDFRSSGKFVIAYGTVIGQKDYYLASVADAVYLNPVGYLDFGGFNITIAYFKQLLDRLEIKPQVFYAGKFKSATEPFRLDSMSRANELQLREYLDDVSSNFLATVSKARGIGEDELFRIMDNLEVRTASDARKKGLVDGLKYRDQVQAILREKLGIDEKDKIELVDIRKYAQKAQKSQPAVREYVAVLFAEGNIIEGNEEDGISGKRYAKIIQDIRENDKVKALVLRVNSPGGSALASEIILRELELTAEEIPVIVSMGDVVASGGYYISCKADTIVAEPTTITGSIGVFGLLPDMQGFFNNKLHITFDGVKVGKHADMGLPYRPLKESEKQIIQASIDSIYHIFKSHVSAGRGLTMAQVDSIAQGRIWTGKRALEIGLVDVLGGLDDAVEIAAKQAGLETYRIKEYPEAKDPFEQLLKELSGEAKTRWLKQELGEYFDYYQELKQWTQYRGPIARMPFSIEVN